MKERYDTETKLEIELTSLQSKYDEVVKESRSSKLAFEEVFFFSFHKKKKTFEILLKSIKEIVGLEAQIENLQNIVAGYKGFFLFLFN